EEVKGFGLTLLIGIFASLFTALFVTKTIFGIMVDKFGKQDLSSIPRSYPKWDKLLTPKIDWMSKAGLFGVVSAVIVSVGVVLFGYYFSKGRVLDIEFAGGTTAQFELREPSDAAELRDLLAVADQADDNPLGDAQVVSIELPGQTVDGVTWEVVANDKDKAAVTDAIVLRLGDRLNIRQAASFDGDGEEFGEAEDVRVLPIISGASDLGGLPVDPELIASNVGGVAVVLENLTPMLEESELRDRVIQERLKGYNGDGLAGAVTIEVQSFPSTGDAVVLVSNPDFAYEEDNLEIIDAWRGELAEPVWSMTKTAVNNPDELQKVTNIGSQVASEFSRNAIIAVILSVIAIMVYIWARFGDLKYSTATVVALAHDTLFCLAGLGYAHLLSGFFLGDWLLLDPFRLNLTQVAAILTVMGFSMNDTVVVFDRIRENRGKYGTLNRQIVNDSINQTLSRTLLTGGTTIVTIFVMYVTGGPGIHGFTFAMLVGIITGTYSSIAIASPILLVGKHVLGDENEPLPEDEAPGGAADQGAMAAT
ncbi:MAG: protein translocase subunit SecF, partial [Planctomycetota bacterium]